MRLRQSTRHAHFRRTHHNMTRQHRVPKQRHRTSRQLCRNRSRVHRRAQQHVNHLLRRRKTSFSAKEFSAVVDDCKTIAPARRVSKRKRIALETLRFSLPATNALGSALTNAAQHVARHAMSLGPTVMECACIRCHSCTQHSPHQRARGLKWHE